MATCFAKDSTNLLKIRSPKTVEVAHAVISGIFTENNELGEVNPAHRPLNRVLPAKRKRFLNEPDPLKRQNLESFLGAAWAKLPVPYSLVLEAMAMAGLRLGEALCYECGRSGRLEWSIQCNRDHPCGPLWDAEERKRLIDLDDTRVGRLEFHIKKIRKEALAGGTLQRGYFFPGFTQRMIRRAMKRTCNWEPVVPMSREKFKWKPHENESTDAEHRGGTTRSSDEVP
jgi:hypothetical protein